VPTYLRAGHLDFSSLTPRTPPKQQGLRKPMLAVPMKLSLRLFKSCYVVDDLLQVGIVHIVVLPVRNPTVIKGILIQQPALPAARFIYYGSPFLRVELQLMAELHLDQSQM
jgi:hypothetical protein